MIPQQNSHSLVAALTLNLSCLQQAKQTLAKSTQIIPFLTNLLQHTFQSDTLTKIDALQSLHNLSTHQSNLPILLRHNTIPSLLRLITEPRHRDLTERALATLTNLGGIRAGKDSILMEEGVMGELAGVLEEGELAEREQAAACLVVLCEGDERCGEMAMEEGVIAPLVCLSVNGTVRGRAKAQRLLMGFRERRKEVEVEVVRPVRVEEVEERSAIGKSASTRVIGRRFSFFGKNRFNSTRR